MPDSRVIVLRVDGGKDGWVGRWSYAGQVVVREDNSGGSVVVSISLQRSCLTPWDMHGANFDVGAMAG